MGPRSRMAGVEDRRIRRKLIKHLVEKRRRGRINQCLEDLRCLVLEAMNKQPEQYEKMEKADILEMAVQHMRHVRHPPDDASPKDKGAHFDSGFRACVHEIAAFLDSYPNLDEGVKHRLLTQLQNKTKKRATASASATLCSPPYSAQVTPKRTVTSTMDIQCTLSLQPHPSAMLPSPGFPPGFSPHMSPFSPGFSPGYCHPNYLQFTPVRSADSLFSPELGTPKTHIKKECRRAISTPPSRRFSPQIPVTSPMWRPW